MWKRTLCFILAFVMLFGVVSVQAEKIPAGQSGSSAFCTVKVMDDSGMIRYVDAIYHLGTWFFSADFYSAYTDYTYDAKTGRFLLDGTDASQAGKSDDVFRKIVQVDTAGKTIGVGNAITALDDVITANGKLWLPAYQVLPYLDTGCTVTENVLILSKGRYTFARMLDRLWLDSFYFDVDSAFGNKFIRKTTVIATWLWDTLTAFRLDRLIPFFPFDNDIHDILTGYMTDHDGMERYASDIPESIAENKDLEFLYKRNKDLQKIMAKGEPISFFSQVLDVNSKKNRSVFFPEEAKDAADKFWEEYKETGEKTKPAQKALGWGLKLVEDYEEMQVNAASMIDDHADMLLAVYPDMATNEGKWETEAQILYETYKNKDTSALSVGFGRSLLDLIYNEIVLNEGFDLIFSCICSASISGIRLTLGLGNAIVNDVIPYITKTANKLFGTDIHLGAEAMDDMALMQYHLTALKTAREAYEGYLEDINVNGNYTQENLEKMRLSAIMTLLVSKKCFEIMRDNSVNLFATRSQKAAKKTCEVAIDQITGKLAFLYAAGAYVLADGREYFEAAIPEYREQFAALSAMDDSLLKHYWNYLLSEGFDTAADPYVFMEDITGDGFNELFISDYRSGKSSFYAYSYNGGEIGLIDLQTQEAKDGEVKCVFLTADPSGRPGLLTLTVNVDTYDMQNAIKTFRKRMTAFATDQQALMELIFSCVESVGWEFTVFDRRGVNDIPDFGTWTGGDKIRTLLDKLAQYEGDELMLFWYGDSEIMDLMSGVPAFAHNPIRWSDRFAHYGERYDNKPIPENELGKPVPSVYAGKVSLPAMLFEYSALTQILSQYSDISYLIRDAEQDGDEELLVNAYDDINDFALVVTADLNDGTLSVYENGSAAGGLFFTEYMPTGATLLKEYYYSAMNVMDSYYEWTGNEWKQTAYMEEKVQEDSPGNWVTTSSGNWWGQPVTADGFRDKERAEITDILRGYSPDLTRVQLMDRPSEYREELYRYLREERAARFGLDPGADLVAYSTGDLDLDGVEEEIYVVVRPADPWLAAIRSEQKMGTTFPEEEDCAFIIVVDQIDDNTLQIVIGYHYDDFDGAVRDSDVSVSNGVLRIKGTEFVYNGTYLVNMDYIG